MTTIPDALALVLEVFTWFGLVPGILLLGLGYLRRILAMRFEETWGIIVESPAGTSHLWFRWMDLERELQSAPIPPDADEELALGDEVKVYFDRRNPHNGRLDHPSADGRVLRVCGWVLVSVGLAAAVIQLVMVFAE